MEKKRSIGVTVFGILCIIYTLLHFSMPLSLLKEAMSFVMGKMSTSPFNMVVLVAMSIISWGELIGFFVGGIGVLRLASWGRRLVIIAAILGIFAWAYAGILGGKYTVENKTSLFPFQLSDTLIFISGFIGTMICSIFNLLCIFFFTRPKVKEQFK